MTEPVRVSFRISIPNTKTEPRELMHDLTAYLQALVDVKVLCSCDIRGDGPEAFVAEISYRGGAPGIFGREVRCALPRKENPALEFFDPATSSCL